MSAQRIQIEFGVSVRPRLVEVQFIDSSAGMPAESITEMINALEKLGPTSPVAS